MQLHSRETHHSDFYWEHAMVNISWIVTSRWLTINIDYYRCFVWGQRPDVMSGRLKCTKVWYFHTNYFLKCKLNKSDDLEFVYQSQIELSLILLTYMTHTIGNKWSFMSYVIESGSSPGNSETGVSDSPISNNNKNKLYLRDYKYVQYCKSVKLN